MSFTEQELAPSSAANWSYQMVGRLKAGVTAAQAVSDAGRVAAETVRNYPAFMAGFSIRPVVRPLHEETVEQARPLVRTLFLAVAVVLLIACANLAGLLLVRAIRRRREVAVRLALGAQAAALLRQAILESLVLSVAGGVVGLPWRELRSRGLELLPETLPRINEIGLDWQVVGFALALAVVTEYLRPGSGICGDSDERERHVEGRRTDGHLGRRACAAAFGAGSGGDCGRAGAAGGFGAAVAQF